MLETLVIGDRLKALGFELYSGVPCSFLNDLINYAINHTHYIGAANEGEAVAICAGAWLGGKKSVVLMQNSGLANAISPLTSLNAICRIPVLGFVSLRGEPGLHDEPQHELMGAITTSLLETMRIPWEYLASTEPAALEQIERANRHIEAGQTFFFVVRKNSFAKVPLKPLVPLRRVECAADRAERAATPLSRAEVLQRFIDQRTPDTALIATTGFTGRELHDTRDLECNFYMVGSMGCASSIALGLAAACPARRIVCLDGDGAALMRLGAFATNGSQAPANLLHVLLDNGCHESTGGQLTASANVDWPALAAASGYARVVSAGSAAQLAEGLSQWQGDPQLTFMHIPLRLGTRPDLSRPKHRPADVTQRFRTFVAQPISAGHVRSPAWIKV